MKLSLFFFIFFSSIVLNGQIKAVTEEGQNVILYKNNTWQLDEVPETGNIKDEPNDGHCDEYIKTTFDKVTGKSSTFSKGTLVISKDGGKNGFGILGIKSAKTVVLSIKAVGAGSCIDDKNKMNLLFRDGTRLELVNDGKFNCEAKYTQYLGGTFGKKKELEMLMTKSIEIIRVWTSKGHVEETLSSEQSFELMNTIRCLSE